MNEDEPKKILINIITEYGIDIVKQKNRILDIISNKMRNYPREKNLFSIALKEGVIDPLFLPENIDKPTILKQMKLCKETLINHYCMQEEWADYVVNCFSCGFEYSTLMGDNVSECREELFQKDESATYNLKYYSKVDDCDIANNTIEQEANDINPKIELLKPNVQANDQKNIKVKTYADGGKYEGEWKDDNPHGHGIYISADGDMYEGDFKEGSITCGTFIWASGEKYEGEWKEYNRHGYGTDILANGEKYVGEWKEDKKHGHGTYIWPDGGKYEGEWKEGKRHGYGRSACANGQKYGGEWKEDEQYGYGTGISVNGDKYEGEWKDGIPDGRGTYIYANGDKYEGKLKEDKPQGHGIAIYANGDTYDGEWQDGKQHGHGTYIWSDGETYDGEFKDGEIQNNKSGSGCYITTATCESLGKSDECYELNLFRKFRDNWLANMIDGRQLIDEYYQTAPFIVERINSMNDKNSIYKVIWEKYLQPCLEFLETYRYKECKTLYIKMINELRKEYFI